MVRCCVDGCLTSVKRKTGMCEARPMNCWAGGVRFAPDAPQGEAMVWEPVDQQVIPQSIAVSQADEDLTEP
jgi:hypothetical protein